MRLRSRVRGARYMRPLQLFAAKPYFFYSRLLLPISALLTLTGYFRPWISHRAAGLTVLGLDLGELVKFLYPVQQGDIRLWREGFYLPLLAVSVSLSLNAFRREEVDGERSHPTYGWPVRIGLLLLAAVAALNLLPPAWSPRLLATPEFRLQVAALLLCLALAAVSPFAALMLTPRTFVVAVGRGALAGPRSGFIWRSAHLIALLRACAVVALAGAAIYFPLAQFQWILPTLADIYGGPPQTGWGPALTAVGLAGLLLHGLGDIYKVINER